MLETRELDWLKNTVTSPGWTDLYAPDIDRERVMATDALLRAQSERAEPKWSDDYLRGYIRGLSYAIGRPFVLVRDAEAALVREKRDAFENTKVEHAVGSPYGAQEESP